MYDYMDYMSIILVAMGVFDVTYALLHLKKRIGESKKMLWYFIIVMLILLLAGIIYCISYNF